MRLINDANKDKQPTSDFKLQAAERKEQRNQSRSKK